MRSCLPLNSAPSILAIASSASARFTNLTKAKPRGSPLFCVWRRHVDCRIVGHVCSYKTVRLLMRVASASTDRVQVAAHVQLVVLLTCSCPWGCTHRQPHQICSLKHSQQNESKMSGRLRMDKCTSTSAHRTNCIYAGRSGICDSGRTVNISKISISALANREAQHTGSGRSTATVSGCGSSIRTTCFTCRTLPSLL
jgi:hypothetical protein